MFELQPPQDDGLYVGPSVGPWSAQKHHFLRRYIDAFMTAMRNKKWDGLHYIDLFAGAGIERIEGNGLDWGSPLIAAQSPLRFSRLHLCEKVEKKYRALAERLIRFQQPTAPQLIRGDANAEVAGIVDEIPSGALSLAFLDPYGLHLHFEALKRLSTRRVDFIIFFPDHLDALRNWEEVYAGKADSNLDRVLGGAAWLPRMLEVPRERWAEVLGKIYVAQIKSLGYRFFDFERIARSDGRFLYRLIFCSRGEAGLKIWRGIAMRKAGGQGSLNFHE